MKLTFYTDGASRGNPGRGGWGVYIEMVKDKLYTSNLSGAEKDTTNNKMELQAAIEALRYTKKNLAKIIKNEEVKIKIKLDSKYVKTGITEWIINWEKNGWKGANKKPVLNKDLWQELLNLKDTINDKLKGHNFPEIKWEYVEGHAGIKGNEIADKLATEAADSIMG